MMDGVFLLGMRQYDADLGRGDGSRDHASEDRARELIYGNWNEVGYERNGEDHCDPPLSDEALEVAYEKFLEAQGGQEMVANIPENLKIMMKGFLSNRPTSRRGG